MNIFRLALLSYLAVISTCWSSLPWTYQDMLDVKKIKDVSLSPDASEVTYTVVTSSLEENKFINTVHKASTQGKNGDVSLTTLESSSMLATWSPDGKQIAFLSDRTGKLNLFLMNKDGSNVVQLTNGSENIETYKWSPDGSMIAFVMPEVLIPSSEMETSFVVDAETKINRLWIVSKSGGVPKALTNDKYYVRGSGGWGTSIPEFDWSPDSKKIAFGSTKGSGFESFFMYSTINVVDVGSGSIMSFTNRGGFENMPTFSPDGKSIAFLESELACSYFFYRKVVVANLDGTDRKDLAPTPDEGPYLMGQNLIGWSPDGNNLLFLEPHGTKFTLYAVPVDGSKPTTWTGTDMLYTDISVSKKGSSISFVGQTSANAPEVYIASLEDGIPLQLTHLNDNVQKFNSIKTEVIQWKGLDGLTIEGLLTYPVNYQEGQSYPLLLEIHGGPMSFYYESFIGFSYIYPIPLYSQAGYFVLRPNPRGSCGYGLKFRAKNIGDVGGADFQDMLAGVDYVINKGQADANRLGIMGWSYGGMMSAWAVTQTDRFKAASMGAAGVNYISMDGTMDCHSFVPNLFLGEFWDNLSLYLERSPIFHVQNAHTPCLILHGEADVRVPVSQSYEFYRALKKLGHYPKFVVYPKMGHGPSKPKQYLNLMENNYDWFTSHIQ